MSRLEAHEGFFRLLMKGIFGPYVLWPFDKKLIFLISNTKNLEEKDGQRQLLYYVSLIRACDKVLCQSVYIGKNFVLLKENLGI